MKAPQHSRSIGDCLGLGLSWLESSLIEDPPSGAYGWGHYRGEDEPTVWGGTVDSINALLSLGVPALDPRLSKATNWIRSQQRPDGGFGSRELQYSAAESTAWVVIVLTRMGLSAQSDAVLARAVDYLRKCVGPKGSVSTTPMDSTDPRTMPAALTLWALALQGTDPVTVGLIAENLRLGQEPTSHGWGVSFGAPANPSNTAQVLIALRWAGIARDAVWVREAADYLLSAQRGDGSWRNSSDEWFTAATPHLPYRCSNFGTAWGLTAMLWFPEGPYADSSWRASERLIAAQLPGGAWQFDAYDPKEHVWCSAQALTALSLWRAVDGGGPQHPKVAAVMRSFRAGLTWLRGSLLYLLVAALVLWQFRSPIVALVRRISDSFDLDPQGIATNLVSSLIWLIFTIGLGWALRSLVGRSKNRRSE
jgi:hypothetical protein